MAAARWAKTQVERASSASAVHSFTPILIAAVNATQPHGHRTRHWHWTEYQRAKGAYLTRVADGKLQLSGRTLAIIVQP